MEDVCRSWDRSLVKSNILVSLVQIVLQDLFEDELDAMIVLFPRRVRFYLCYCAPYIPPIPTVDLQQCRPNEDDEEEQQ